jgi:CRISPR-associated protein Cas6
MVFDLTGASLPAAYPFVLWAALTRHLPALQEDERISLVPLRTAESEHRHLLTKRTKLRLRVPSNFSDTASALCGAELDLSGTPLVLGTSRVRPLQPHPTLHAQLVTGDRDETRFMTQVRAQLDALSIDARMICGLASTLSDCQQHFSGYSLVLHDLKPEASLRLQCAGMGEGRRFGCGVFVPYKAISGLD